jgi:hypothetical protein
MTEIRFPALRNRSWAVLAAVAAAGAITLVSVRGETAQPAPTPTPTPITISSTVPGELNMPGGGAPDATLDQAAAFAWQEFIALSWPATSQNGEMGDRDTPASDCLLSGVPNPAAPTPGTDCATRPLTWQTFRGKAEIFTQGATQSYDTPPTYSDLYLAPIASCTGSPPPAQAAWVNLDETTQIFEDAMFAGGAPTTAPNNSQPQLIRFMAKANRQEFTYYNALGGAPGVSSLRAATLAFIRTGDPPPGSMHYVSLPNNTIEIKAGWRVLTAAEQASGRFHTTTVRYYEQTGQGGAFCYNEAQWGLVALHIIQKTPSAPYFIYATFEQADNIQTPAGQAVEDANGAIATLPPCRADQTAPCPTTPSLNFNDTATVNTTQPPLNVPPSVTVANQPNSQVPQQFCQTIGNRLYYVNNNMLPAIPNGQPICINYRYNLIPPTIVAANQRAHAAIALFNSQNNIRSSPWLYYKLINVQYFPLNNEPPSPYSGNQSPPYLPVPPTAANPQNFYLANIVVETNRPLQMFSGSLVQGNPGTGSNSEYDSQFGGPAGSATHRNVYYQGLGHNMGGCMGCHGAQGQGGGGDFSVILARGQVDFPEPVPQYLQSPPPTQASRRNQPRRR